jgi:hypothetical protein
MEGITGKKTILPKPGFFYYEPGY